MSNESSDFAKAAAIHKEHQALQAKVDELELNWIQTAESLDDIVAKLATHGRT
jgi:hypothetical protein